MPEGYIIDWTVVAALFATTAAFVAAAVTYFSNKRRHDLDARIEICKYREKWLEQLRNEVMLLSSLHIVKMNSDVTPVEKREFFKHLSKINLLVNSSNSHWPDLQKSLDNLIEHFGTTGNLGMPNFEQTAKKILKEEWDEIQDLLYKKKKKNNAKNK